jgi:hypothetical protein
MERIRVICSIESQAADTLRFLQEQAFNRVRLDRVIPKTTSTFYGGTEKKTTKEYLLGDFFDSITIASETDLEFKVIFDVKPNAQPFWKDLVIAVLHSIVADRAFFSVQSSLCIA